MILYVPVYCFKTSTWLLKHFQFVFLFIICIRFPKGKSITDIIRNRYGEAFVRKICKFKKNNHKLRESHLDQKFLPFKLGHRYVYNSLVYKKCQIKLSEEEIRAKPKRNNILEKDTKKIKELQGTISCLDLFIYLLLVSSR